jgi:hypothetical protein
MPPYSEHVAVRQCHFCWDRTSAWWTLFRSLERIWQWLWSNIQCGGFSSAITRVSNRKKTRLYYIRCARERYITAVLHSCHLATVISERKYYVEATSTNSRIADCTDQRQSKCPWFVSAKTRRQRQCIEKRYCRRSSLPKRILLWLCLQHE